MTLLTTIVGFRGRHLSYQRGRRTTHPATSLIKIEGVDDTAAAKYVEIDSIPISYVDTFANKS
jgi:ribosomal protein L35AE/L33A